MKEWIEKRTGYLFGTYTAKRAALTDPWVAVGPCELGSGLEHYPSGVWIKVGSRCVYVIPDDGMERGRARAIQRLEQHANREDA